MNDLFDPAGESVADATLYEPHPAALLIPPPTEAEYAALCASIRDEGVRVPVVLWKGPDGKVWLLDGIHRQKAAGELGVECPHVYAPEDTDPTLEAIALNISRRHLTAGQRAAIADLASADSAVGNPNFASLQNRTTQTMVAEKAGVGHAQVSRARQIRLAPDMIVEMVAEEAANHDRPEVKQFVLDYPVDEKIAEVKALYGEMLAGRETLSGTVKAVNGVLNPLPKQLKGAADKKKREVDEEEKKKDRRWAVHMADITDADTWEIEAESVDVIFTDPPYAQTAIPLIGHLARFAKRVLKPDGILLAVTGNMCADQWYAHLSAELTYVWTLGVGLTQNKAVQGYPVYQHHKPIVLYRKGKMPDRKVPDFIRSDGITGQGVYHEWGQSVGLVMSYLSRFAPAGEDLVIADPFLGAGSTGLAAYALGHRFIGFDKDEGHVDTARGLLVEAEAEAAQ